MSSKRKKRKKRIKQRQQTQLQTEKVQRKAVRHNTAANQEKHRLDWQPLEPDEEGLIADRRIMPRDEQDRRLGNEAASAQAVLADFDDGLWAEMAAESPFLLGIVIEVSRGLCRVALDDVIVICDIRGILTAEDTGYTNIVGVGDRVLVRQTAADRGLVEQVLPRRSALARADSFNTHLKQIIAANIDQLLIVASWRKPRIWLEMIDEYLIGAARNNLKAIICINKIDLAQSISECQAAVDAYHDLDYPVYFTSATTGQGLAALQTALQGQTTVLAGLSGVGKSSLLTTLDPRLDLKTKAISLKRHEGRHTTTQAIMLPLGDDAYVVDTPGIRDLGLTGLTPPELISFYPEIEAVSPNCRYNNCAHDHEPDCAVKTAVAAGKITPWRHNNYLKLHAKLQEM